MENNQKELMLLQDLGMQFATSTSKRKHRYGLYKCFCGNEFRVQISSVKNKLTTSCGCLQKQKVKEMFGKHNLTKHRLYTTWNNMMSRCNNKNNPLYNHYGARGVSVCEDWLSPQNFIKDMYPSFKDGLTLDRIDNNKGYYKDNCRWVNQNIQTRNTRTIYSHNKSGFRGVFFDRSRNKFIASIKVNSKQIYLGRFKTSLDAAKAYDTYVLSNKLEHTINGIGL